MASFPSLQIICLVFLGIFNGKLKSKFQTEFNDLRFTSVD